MYIELKNISKTIKDAEVLTDINYLFESGKVYGLQGKNGCGKTMLMRIISGLIRPTKGEVDINGKILWRDLDFPDSIGTLIENPAFIDGYTGFKNLKMLASIKGKINDNDINDAMTRVGLNPDDKRKYRKYSLGMKQKLGIACAFMEYPEIVILDEPINAIDKDGVVLVRKILDDLKKNNKFVIFACHDAEEMKLLADEVINMEEGKFVARAY